jgi:Flp pilus assembly protein TadD
VSREESAFHVVSAGIRDAVRADMESISKSAGGPDHPAAQYLEGQYAVGRGLYHDAAASFTKLSQLVPESPAPHEALGTVYRAIGLMDLAAAEFQRALELTRPQ